MADVPLVLSDVLCFSLNKYGKVSLKTLRSVLMDYYPADALSEAKFQLVDDIDKLNLTIQRPHVLQRRDVDGRIAKEVDDIISLFNFVDENKLIDKLPKYVASSPDTMPSLRLYDGDMNTIMNLLRSLDVKMVGFGSALAAINREINNLQQVCRQPQPPHLFDPMVMSINSVAARDVNKTGPTSRAEAGSQRVKEIPVTAVPTENTLETATNSVTVAATATSDWATLSSTPCHNRFAVLSGDNDNNNDDTDADDGAYVTVARRGNKRPRHRTNPQQHPQYQQQQEPTEPPKSTRTNAAVIGKQSTIMSWLLKP